MEKLTKENECQRQDINQLQFTNEILEEHIHKNIRQECNDQGMIKQKKAKERKQKKRGKNDQNKEMKMSKKKIGIKAPE